MTRLLRITLLGLLIIAGLLATLIYSLTWRPEAKETLPVSCVAPRAPTLLPGQALKVMTWNVQYWPARTTCSGTTPPTAVAQMNAPP